ncbi:MAG: DUF2332 domain-containing protein [Acidimicrobiales bacterium]
MAGPAEALARGSSSGPPKRRPTAAEVIEYQANACATVGSALYQQILLGVLEDVRVGGVTADVLRDRGEDPFGSALALRFLGAVHRVVLEGRAPALAALYPSAGGDPSAGDPVRTFLATVAEHREEVVRRTDDAVQTNEVGRSAVLVGGYAEVLHTTGLPLRVLEIGASAGLNLRFDHYAYDTGRQVAGDPTSPVRFRGLWEGPPPRLPGRFAVARRVGCDLNPIDATTEEGRLRLLSFTWPDQLDRIARLEAAIEVARRVPLHLDRADAVDWLGGRLAERTAGLATVVTHSIVLQYLPREGRLGVRRVLEAAGRAATPEAPVAWLRMEPAGGHAELRLTEWPGGEERLLATAGFHGHPIRWGT